MYGQNEEKYGFGSVARDALNHNDPLGPSDNPYKNEAEGRVWWDGWDGWDRLDGISFLFFNFLRPSNHNVPQGPSDNPYENEAEGRV